MHSAIHAMIDLASSHHMASESRHLVTRVPTHMITHSPSSACLWWGLPFLEGFHLTWRNIVPRVRQTEVQILPLLLTNWVALGYLVNPSASVSPYEHGSDFIHLAEFCEASMRSWTLGIRKQSLIVCLLVGCNIWIAFFVGQTQSNIGNFLQFNLACKPKVRYHADCLCSAEVQQINGMVLPGYFHTSLPSLWGGIRPAQRNSLRGQSHSQQSSAFTTGLYFQSLSYRKLYSSSQFVTK